MKRILLTSTALVMVAGIAAADGHASMSWSGKATAGIARAGSGPATAAVAVRTGAVYLADQISFKARGVLVANPLQGVALGSYGTKPGVNASANRVPITMAGLTATAAEITQMFASAAYNLAAETKTAKANGNKAGEAAAKAKHALRIAELTYMYGIPAQAKKDAGDFKAYSEVNATVTGSVTAGGMTLSAGVSVDAGTGYDFADDDAFDGAKTNGVSLDAVSLDMGSAGKLTLNDNAVTHLVDADDDATGDVSYTNTFGGATFTAVMDLDKNDLDAAASKVGTVQSFATANVTATSTVAAQSIGDYTGFAAAVAADVQWSAKVAMPVGAGTVYVAMDEESGNAFGGSAVVSGMTVSVDSKLEALGSDLKSNRANTIGVATTMGAVSGNFKYDSIKDGNQWSVGAGYTAGDMSVAFATNEASSWSVSGNYALGTGASIKAGVNYTEDAFLGLSFAF